MVEYCVLERSSVDQAISSIKLQVKELLDALVPEFYTDDAFEISKVSGGMTNFVFRCSKAGSSGHGDVLLRIYGFGTEILFSREEEKEFVRFFSGITCALTASSLSERRHVYHTPQAQITPELRSLFLFCFVLFHARAALPVLFCFVLFHGCERNVSFFSLLRL
jgi:hypothetical protein